VQSIVELQPLSNDPQCPGHSVAVGVGAHVHVCVVAPHVPFVPRPAQLAEHVHWPPQPLGAVPEHNPAQAVACGVGLHVHELCVDVLQV